MKNRFTLPYPLAFLASKQFIISICVVLTSLSLSGQSLSSQTYPYGIMPTNANNADVLALYTSWKSTYVSACANGRYRVEFDNPSETVSEGIAYGMLASVYADDQAIFDGLWLYYQDNVNGNGVMNWKINGCSGATGFNGATDAELDAAMALIVAYYKWGNGTINYQNAATALIQAIKTHEVEAVTRVLKPGDAFGGSSITNISYYSPGYYRAYGAFTNDSLFWAEVATKAYDVINDNLSVNSAVGGLVSDWCTSTGAHSNAASGYQFGGTRYLYDAARTPWRIALDHSWYGSSESAAYLALVNDFVNNTVGGLANVRDGYLQDGTVTGSFNNATFV
ncbi:MAG: glycosyl hydrolase family 8, partial [Bacteroidota bacterium]